MDFEIPSALKAEHEELSGLAVRSSGRGCGHHRPSREQYGAIAASNHVAVTRVSAQCRKLPFDDLDFDQ